MVVAAERTRKRDLATALTSLRTVDVAPAGFVLNFVQVDASDSYRYGKYRYQPSQADTNSTPAPRTVSYTHLDVYKRQVHQRAVA